MHTTFAISVAEFSQRRSSFEFCRWINEKLEEMRATGRFNELYFERNDPRTNVKKLVEEAIPLSRLGLFLSTPESEVFLTCFADSGGHDALVEVMGFNQRTFKVEVTTTESESSILRRQALSRYGHVALTGSIIRAGREITATPEMIDAEEEDERCIGLMFDRLRRKLDSRRYGGDTAILVFSTDFRAIAARHRADLIVRTERFLLETQAKVAGVYYCYTADYSIDRVGPV